MPGHEARKVLRGECCKCISHGESERGKTGAVRAGIEAEGAKEFWVRIPFRPYLGWGVGLIILGICLIFVDPAAPRELRNLLMVAWIMALLGGAICLLIKQLAEFPMDLRCRIRCLSLGEVTERLIRKENAQVTDLLADLTTTFAVDLSVSQSDKWAHLEPRKLKLAQRFWNELRLRGIRYLAESGYCDRNIPREMDQIIEQLKSVLDELASRTQTFVERR